MTSCSLRPAASPSLYAAYKAPILTSQRINAISFGAQNTAAFDMFHTAGSATLFMVQDGECYRPWRHADFGMSIGVDALINASAIFIIASRPS